MIVSVGRLNKTARIDWLVMYFLNGNTLPKKRLKLKPKIIRKKSYFFCLS